MMKNKKLAALLGLLLAGSMTVSMAACVPPTPHPTLRLTPPPSLPTPLPPILPPIPAPVSKRFRLARPVLLKSRIRTPAR